MNVISLEEKEKFSSSEQEIPSPGPGEVLVKSGAVGMCGTDFHAYDGNQNFFTYPRVLGHELGVTVVSFGEGTDAAGILLWKPLLLADSKRLGLTTSPLTYSLLCTGLAVGDKCSVVPYWECGKCTRYDIQSMSYELCLDIDDTYVLRPLI